MAIAAHVQPTYNTVFEKVENIIKRPMRGITMFESGLNRTVIKFNPNMVFYNTTAFEGICRENMLKTSRYLHNYDKKI